MTSNDLPAPWRPIETAPRDGTLLRLLVDFDEHPTEDAERAPTIGHNNLDNDGEDVWQFAGWCWSHDHFTEGTGHPIGWLPFHDELPLFGPPIPYSPGDELQADVVLAILCLGGCSCAAEIVTRESIKRYDGSVSHYCVPTRRLTR